MQKSTGVKLPTQEERGGELNHLRKKKKDEMTRVTRIIMNPLSGPHIDSKRRHLGKSATAFVKRRER